MMSSSAVDAGAVIHGADAGRQSNARKPDGQGCLGIRPFILTLFAALMAAVGIYIAAPQLFNEAYWLTHQYTEVKRTTETAQGGSETRDGIEGGGGTIEGDGAGVGGDGREKVKSDAKTNTVGNKKVASPSPSTSPSRRSTTSSRSSRSGRGGRGGGGARKGGGKFEKVGSDEARAKTPKVYDVGVTCKQHWREMAKKMLEPWAESGVRRESMDKIPISTITHTPMWLRVVRGKLHCVIDPRVEKLSRAGSLRTKIYRARHYVQRVNAILQRGRKLPENLEWWTQHSDLCKVPKGIESLDGSPPPVFSVAGGPDFWDIPGIPFMSFSDIKAMEENEGFREVKAGKSFDERWKAKKTKAFFLGGLSDCSDALENHGGDAKFCGRAKMVRYGAQLAESGETDLLSGIQVYDGDSPATAKLLKGCERCTRPRLKGQEFVRELMDHKFVLNFDGAGNWSRRMSVLLNSGSVVVKAESPGYQFYEFGLEPGVHYVPFDAMVGSDEPGNLRPRLEWLAEFDDVAKQLAERAESFGEACLSEHSINDFVYELLAEYGRLQRGRPTPHRTVDISDCFDRKSCRNKLEPCYAMTPQPKRG